MLLWVNALAVRSGGGLTVLEGLSRALVEQGQGNVRLVVRGDLLPLLSEPVASSAFAAPLGNGLPRRLWWEHARLTRSAAKESVDVVLGLSNVASLLGSRRVRQAVLVQNIAPLSSEIRGMYEGRERLRLEALHRLTLRSVRTTNVTFVFTEYVRTLLRSLAPQARIVRIPPGGALNALRGRPQAEHRTPYVLILSDLRRYKGIEDGLRALAKPALEDMRLVVCGAPAERDYEASLRELARSLGVLSRVRFIGAMRRRDVSDLIGDATCLLQASRMESLGLPVIEALSLGTPVVSTDIPTAREIGGDDVALYRPGDIDALAASIAAVRDEGQSREITARGRRVRFEWRESARAILEELGA